MNRILPATAIVFASLSAPAFAEAPEDLQAQVATLKREKAGQQAEIAALREKVRALQGSPSMAKAQTPGGASAKVRSAMAADLPVYKAVPAAPVPVKGFFSADPSMASTPAETAQAARLSGQPQVRARSSMQMTFPSETRPVSMRACRLDTPTGRSKAVT